MVCYDRIIFENLREQKNLNIEKIIFKVFLAMHIINQKLNFHILTGREFAWNMILISNDLWHKRKIYNFVGYCH